jgi:OOP family OmpA-OmpF porin
LEPAELGQGEIDPAGTPARARADWRRGLLYGVPLFALLFGLAGRLGVSAIETELAGRIAPELAAAGFTKLAVEMDGRDATIRGLLDPGREGEVLGVADRYGVRSVALVVAPDPTPDDDALDPIARFEAGSIVLVGTVFSDAHRQRLVQAASLAVGPDNVFDELQVITPRNPPPQTDQRIEALASLTQDMASSMEAGQASLLDGELNLSGRLTAERAGVAIATERARAVTSRFTDVNLTVALDPPLPPPTSTAPTTATTAASTTAGPTTTSPAAVPNPVIAEVNAVVGASPLQFEFGSGTLSSAADSTLDRIAELLLTSPAAVSIEGHTDADGDAALNQALSQQRADAVRSALIERGVPAVRLVAVGYGAARPVAPNTTPEGRAANRRVVFTASGAS